MKDFHVSKFKAYPGPSYYLDTKGLVFNLSVSPSGPSASFYRDAVLKHFPALEKDYPDRVAELFARILVQVLKMDIDLFINQYAISRDGDDYVIAVEYLDEYVAQDSAYLVGDWLRALTDERRFDFAGEFAKLQQEFDKTLFGGPTIYSLVEGGLKRDIPVIYLYEENVFQWGYGCKQLRGRSTIFHTDGIKDTEFTMYKDMVKDFLLMCGFPTPHGKNCFKAEEIVAEARKLGFPVVVKPLAGHKGQGVTTNIQTEDHAIKAFQALKNGAREAGAAFDGAIVEKQITGTDHRLLTVKGKFAAALERVPAYVDGNGSDTIEKLIAIENDKEVRLDNARSPLTKIRIDDDLLDYLKRQNLGLDSVPQEGERIFLRRVANISAGGVSINVTDKIHPKNIKLTEDIARYFNVTCMGIDVLTEDIGKPWDESSFGIIEINAGPGVFMHLAPAIGGSIDVPGKIMNAVFPAGDMGRIPIIAGNRLSKPVMLETYKHLTGIKEGIQFGWLTDEGVHFNDRLFHKNADHNQNVKIILRHPEMEIAAFSHSTDDIYDCGLFHQGADVVILEQAGEAEQTLKNQLLHGGILIEIDNAPVGEAGKQERIIKLNGEEKTRVPADDEAAKDQAVLDLLKPMLKDLLSKYKVL